VSTPTRYNEGAGSFIVDDGRVINGANSSVYIRHPDGRAEWRAVLVVPVTSPGTDATGSILFNTGMTWAEAPFPFASLASALSTASFEVQKLQASATLSGVTVLIRANTAQSYGIALKCEGRWK
jgi:hypothetical protein